MRELALFAGAGGGCIASRMLGHTVVGYVEWEAFPQAVLQARFWDGHLGAAPIFGDVRAFVRDGWARRYRGRVDLVSAGFPCPAFSVAGKRHGGADERNMWPATRDVLREVRPAYAFLENVPGLLSVGDGPASTRRYFGTVLGDLAALGFDAEWGVLGAHEVGAPHRRDRLWILAYLPDAERDGVRFVAERNQLDAAERGDAEPGDDGAAR